jgi:replication factor C subunit 2/4
VLKRMLQSNNLPHCLMYGPPGTGKTSTLLALARELFGPDLLRSRVLELNASDERGINIVRLKIKDFARQQLSNPPTGPAGVEYRKKYPVPPFKIIILDEADSMTQDAQSALRRTMETYSKITRFCLVCNYVTRIIDPLASRCSKFRFKSLDKENAAKRLDDISRLENVALEDGAVDALVRCSEGDLRKAITFLQSAARLVGALSSSSSSAARDADGDEDMQLDGESPSKVTVKIVEEIAGVVPNNIIDHLYSAMRAKRQTGPGYDAVAKAVEDLVADGWSGTQVLSQLYERVIYDETVSDRQKAEVVMVFSEVDKRLVDGADEQLAILDLALRASKIIITDS